MEVTCEDVWREVSNYIEGTTSTDLQKAIELHLQECRPCAAVLEGAQSLIRLVGRDAAFQMPTDFCQRLYRRQCEIQAKAQHKES